MNMKMPSKNTKRGTMKISNKERFFAKTSISVP
jgi:hypothetical protein